MIKSFINIKRIGVSLVLILSLAITPALSTDSNVVHAARQDDMAKIANKRLGQRHYNCSGFVWEVAKSAGLMNGRTFPKKRVGGTNDIQRYFTKKKQYYYSNWKFKPKKGDLAIFGSSTHIGIVTGVSGNYVYVTHGNWGGKVRRTKIKKTGWDGRAHAKIKGYVRLNYYASEPWIRVKFNGNGGKSARAYKNIKNTSKVGWLSKVSRPGYKFLGWYTKSGRRVYTTTKIDSKYGITLYAKYKKLPAPKVTVPATVTTPTVTPEVTTPAEVPAQTTSPAATATE